MRKSLGKRQGKKNIATHQASESRTGGTPIIRFPHGFFSSLRGRLLADLSREHFAMLLARRETSQNGREIFVVLDAEIASDADCLDSHLCRVSPSKEFVGRVLVRARQDFRANAVIDVHTHPFTSNAFFSGVDDADERRFSRWLESYDDSMAYASLLLSRETWEARVWKQGVAVPADLKTQTVLEAVPHVYLKDSDQETSEMQSRTALALGVSVIRRITRDQHIVLAGVGGLGSVMAEQLVRSGFSRISLIDPDTLEQTNLNRFAGGFPDCVGEAKVDVVRKHLQRINPSCEVTALKASVDDGRAEDLMAACDWILLSTDNHSSRKHVQQTALRYGVPLLSVGVSITVKEDSDGHHIADQSGEVIVARHGDGFCLQCLGRINPYKVAYESNPDFAVREGLLQKGYVTGMTEKEPAVMPLNATLASMAVQTLIDQYREEATHHPVLVYESHKGSCCYPDHTSMAHLPNHCACCGRDTSVHQFVGGSE